MILKVFMYQSFISISYELIVNILNISKHLRIDTVFKMIFYMLFLIITEKCIKFSFISFILILKISLILIIYYYLFELINLINYFN
jgi:hypothetical protein